MRRARFAAAEGTPMPTKQTQPGQIKRAAAIVIISSGVYLFREEESTFMRPPPSCREILRGLGYRSRDDRSTQKTVRGRERFHPKPDKTHCRARSSRVRRRDKHRLALRQSLSLPRAAKQSHSSARLTNRGFLQPWRSTAPRPTPLLSAH